MIWCDIWYKVYEIWYDMTWHGMTCHDMTLSYIISYHIISYDAIGYCTIRYDHQTQECARFVTTSYYQINLDKPKSARKEANIVFSAFSLVQPTCNINTARPEQSGNILQATFSYNIFLKEKFSISIQISLTFSKRPINNQQWFRWWLVAEKVAFNCLNQYWLRPPRS